MKISPKTHKAIISLAIAFLTLIAGFWMNKFIIKPDYSLAIFISIKIFLLIVSFLAIIILSFFIYKQSKRKKLLNFTLCISSILTIIILLELVFTLYTPSTNDFGDFSNKIWLKKHFTPINKLGYRDTEPKNNPEKKNILVIGDSFVAGHGVKTDEMFTNLLKTKLAMNYSIFNLGVCGSHTQREYDSLLSYPVQPDIIILAYYHNDIESAMNAKGISPNITNPKDELCAFSRLFVNNSLFFNYMFTKYAKSKISAQFMESKNNDILAYLNEDLWQKQTEYLDNFYNYSIENNVRLIIIFFPAMGEGITFTHELAGVKLEEYCIDKGIQYLDLYPKIQNLEVYERVANPMDHHPSAEVNSIIADLITENL